MAQTSLTSTPVSADLLNVLRVSTISSLNFVAATVTFLTTIISVGNIANNPLLLLSSTPVKHSSRPRTCS